jgi:glycosyltransferase 2 family protein
LNFGGTGARLRIAIVTAIGLALVIYLLRHAGFRPVLAAAASVGWRGFVALCIVGLLVFLILGPAWQSLLPSSSRFGFPTFVWARMVRDSAAESLPISQIGGMALGVRAAILQGVAPPLAVASMVVDVTTEMFAQIAYIALGIIILSAHAAHSQLAQSYTLVFSIGLVLGVVGGGIFLVLQRYSHHWVAHKVVGRILPGSVKFTAAAATAPVRLVRGCRRNLARLPPDRTAARLSIGHRDRESRLRGTQRRLHRS